MTEKKDGLTGIQQFIISTLTNAFEDKSNRSVSDKLIRAAIVSVPESITVDTKGMYDSIAERNPQLELQQATRPTDVLDMSRMATQNVINNDTKLRTVAYYVKK